MSKLYLHLKTSISMNPKDYRNTDIGKVIKAKTGY